MATYRCTKCTRTFSEMSELTSHTNSVHRMGGMPNSPGHGDAAYNAANRSQGGMPNSPGQGTQNSTTTYGSGVNTTTLAGITSASANRSQGGMPNSPGNGDMAQGAKTEYISELNPTGSVKIHKDLQNFFSIHRSQGGMPNSPGNGDMAQGAKTEYISELNPTGSVKIHKDLQNFFNSQQPATGGGGNGGGNGGGDNSGGNGSGGGSNIDNRTEEQKAKDFAHMVNEYKDAETKAAGGDDSKLRQLDAFFKITRPEEEYNADFYNKPPALEEPTGWSEKEYLAKNPDVAAAVERGDIPSGLAHYHSSGKAEGRQSDFTPAGWNEKEYLKLYPDVAAAVEKGDLPSGLAHYFSSGKAEGRKSDFGGSIPTASGVGVLPPSIDPVTPQRGSVDESSSTGTPSRSGASFIDEPRKPITANPANQPTKPDPMGTIVDTYVRNDKDSGFAYPWSAAKATGTNDVMGTISKAVDFMNANEGKSYKYDQIKGTIRDNNGTGAFINQADTQSLNNIITKYSKSDFKIVGAGGGNKIVQPVDLTYGGVGTPQKPVLRDVTNGAVRIDSSTNDGLNTVGSGGFAGTTPGVRTHPIEGGFNLP